ncbi:hypothetical protein ACO2Q0_13430 [Phenylobacterium sp. VNQ135]|uniref:hypothetical protein n=1 Tax=Phenylobacterium sp. VNQ135 TaxID=3400922 RepID=UPI003BFF928A
MKTLILAGAVAVATLTAGAAMAQPYGYYGYDNGYRYGGYDRDYRYARQRDSDRDGIPDRREWNRDRDRDGRPDQYDRYDNRRGHRYGHAYGHRYNRYDRYDRYDDRGYYGHRW